MKVSELSGEALDLWVAKAEGHELVTDLEKVGEAAIGIGPAVLFRNESGVLGLACEGGGGKWNPSIDWARGGQIVDRELISLCADSLFEDHQLWAARKDGIFHENGPTALIAAMRCYVASKFGEEVPGSAS
ncbi:DUF2591 family protein [Paraburkholderia fungorum]|uniref:phage protein NinX family protein n=1 Tax=Paraburkholderia fungorum TaxID=134537 RepID=UPI0038BC0947